jgi:hypothetical protein
LLLAKLAACHCNFVDRSKIIYQNNFW